MIHDFHQDAKTTTTTTVIVSEPAEEAAAAEEEETNGIFVCSYFTKDSMTVLSFYR